MKKIMENELILILLIFAKKAFSGNEFMSIKTE
jgi:hypothetical protein